MKNNILHVFSVPFSITYFVGNQFTYFKGKKNNEYFVSCSNEEELVKLSKNLNFIPQPVEIKRSINPIADLKAIFSVYKIIKKHKIDKVVGHSPKGAMVAMISATLARVPERIYFRHGIFYETSVGFKRVLLKNIDRLSGTLATKVVCVSEAVKSISEKEGLNAANKNIILGLGTCNGVDSENRFNLDNYSKSEITSLRKSLGIGTNDFVVGFVGRLVKDKGVNELIDAWQDFYSIYPDSKLLLVGPFEERDAISEATKKTIIEDKSIIHTGNVAETPIYYGLMDTFILPSYREGFPTVVLEASSMGLPILISNATGCEEAIVEGETGLFISHDPKDIVRKIEYLRNNPVKRLELGNKGRKFVQKNFEQTKIWDIIDKELDI